jgi:hypothetical protein
MRRSALFLTGAVALGAGAGNVVAAVGTFTGSDGTRSGMVTFENSGSDLIITLTNTSTLDVLLPNEVMTAVFFDIQGDPLTLARESAVLAGGSIVLFGITDPGGVVGGEWAYAAGLSGPNGADYGISSAGYGLFGPGNRFPGNNLAGPDAPNGLGYGITSAGDDPDTGNTPVTGEHPLIQNSVVFTLSGLPAGFDPNVSISNVSFQYGTDLSEPNVPGVPAPGAGALLAAAALTLAFRRRR